MEYYRQGVKHHFDNLLTDEELQLFLNGELNGTIINEEVVSIIFDVPNAVEKCFEFGDALKKLFIEDNWNTTVTFTGEMSIILTQKFSGVISLCIVGDIKTIKVLLPTIPTDAIFTQERKDKYQNLIDAFVAKTYPIFKK